MTATRFTALTALALLLAAQAPAQETETNQESAAEATEAAEAAPPTFAMDELSADTVIATVGEYELTLGELIAVRQSLPAQYQSLPPAVLSEGLLSQLIDQTILYRRAVEAGLDARTDLRLQLINQRNSALAEAFMRAEMQASITDEAVQAIYDERYANAEPEVEVRAAHILVETEEKAADLKAQIDEGADFAELAAEHGTDGTRTRGGDLGYFSQADMVPEFAEAAFAMEVGTVSAPVQTPFGWHLIKLDDRRDKPVPGLEEVRQQIVEGLAQEAQGAILEASREAVEVSRPEKVLPPEAILADDLIAPAE
ncbi:MAG: peptidylprolyl isomerase [Pseudomonadota bacterium]